jgi:hypothetical protein
MSKWLVVFLLISQTSLTQPSFSRYRTVYIFFTNDSRELLNRQLHWLAADKQSCDERDIRIIEVDVQKAEKSELDKFLVKDKFTVVLVGKDGTEKYRSEKPVPAKVLFALIDQMPMRQSELKRKGISPY